MSYAAIVEGLNERFQTVEGLEDAPILDYEPTSVHEFPLVYTLLDSFTRNVETGQVVRMGYRILHRLVLRWQDNETAEQELIPFVNSVCAAIDADNQLDGRLSGQSGINPVGYIGGYAKIADGMGVFVRIGGTDYRAIDFYSEVFEKFPIRMEGL